MTFFSFLVSFPVSTQTVALREPHVNGSKRQIGVCSCPCGQEVMVRVARSLSVDAYDDQAAEKGCSTEAECGTAGRAEKRLTKRVRC